MAAMPPLRVPRHAARPIVACWLLACAAAQVPAHATVLNPTTFQLRPTLLQVGDDVHAFAFGNTTVFHARSNDGGRTWPLREQALGVFASQNNGAPENAHGVAVAAHAGQLLLASHDGTLGPRTTRSLDGGTTWSNPVGLASAVGLQSNSMRTCLAADGPNVVVAWTNDRPNGRVFCNRSADFGVTWQPGDTLLEVSLAPFPPAVQQLLVHRAGPTVHVLWHDGAVRRQRSLDGGASWLPAVGGLTGATMFATQWLVRVAGDGATLLLLVGGDLLRSTDDGDTWTPAPGHGIPYVMDVAMQGNLAVVAGRTLPLTNTDYFANVSTDGGATWRPTPYLIGGPDVQVRAHAFVDGGVSYVRWQMIGFPGVAMRSDDDGATWQVIEGPVHAGFSPGSERTVHAAIAPLPIFPIRHYAYAGVGSTLLGTGTPGSGGIAPRLSTIGLPVRGRSTTLLVDQALGGGFGGIAISFAPPVALPFAGGTLHLGSLDVLFAFATGGTLGQPGTGSFALPVGIPNVATLIGASLVTQGVVLDPVAIDGMALTNALEIWLR
jgi:hypothetical protein